MSVAVFNKLEKLAAPPFVTVSLSDEPRRKKIFKSWSTIQLDIFAEKTTTFSSEGDLLKAFISRKGTQLRLEKALQFTRRIHTLLNRWRGNAFWEDFSKFREAFESDDAKIKVTKKQSQQKKSAQIVHLPSRQWSNWVIYLILRDILLLAKIKHECERTVAYWLGLISCSHHPGDSLIIVGILSRLWAVSGGMVEDYANQVYPVLCSISSLLSKTKADNWLEDIDFPDELFMWLEKILGFPYKPVSIGGFEQILRKDESKSKRNSSLGSTTMDTILSGVFGGTSAEEDDTQILLGDDDDDHDGDVASTSSRGRDSDGKCENDGDDDDDEEDIGVPVHVEQQQQKGKKRRKRTSFTPSSDGKGQTTKKKKGVKQGSLPGTKDLPCGGTAKKVELDERWTKFFKNFKTKLKTEAGRKQLLTRIKKYKKSFESNPKISERLVKLRKFVKGNKSDKIQIFIPKFKRFLLKESVT